MSGKKNIAASVKGKLLNLARSEGKNHQLLLLRYFQERFLYRLSQSIYKNNFCLKGAAFLYALQQEKSRVTKDIDFLGLNIASNYQNLKKVIAEIVKIEYPNDGVIFDLASISLEDIVKDGNYKGVRIHITGFLEHTRQRLQIDIGFGDIVVPKPLPMTYPVILDMAAPELMAYSVESTIAEKFEAMIDLAEVNTRMKDYYDVYQLLSHQTINASLLENAIWETFAQRSTPMPLGHSLFLPEFYANELRIQRWKAWLRKTKLDEELDFSQVMRIITLKLKPVYLKIVEKNS